MEKATAWCRAAGAMSAEAEVALRAGCSNSSRCARGRWFDVARQQPEEI